MSFPVPDRDRILEALKDVEDPELGESIVALGLVERIDLAPGRADITLVPTSATCPMAEVLLDDTEAAVRRVCPVGTDILVTLDDSVAWSPERLAPELRDRFGWNGAA